MKLLRVLVVLICLGGPGSRLVMAGRFHGTVIDATRKTVASCVLSSLIATNELAPGDRLPSIRELAVNFRVKPGAIRDGLLTAQARGLVKILPRVGAIVHPDGEASGAGDVVANSFDQLVGQRRAEYSELHARTYSALAAGDAEQAQREMRDHIHAAYEGK